MRAIVCIKYGPPEVLQLREVKKPTPKKNEVLIRIHATAVSTSDCLGRGLKFPPISRLLMRLICGFTKPRKSIIGLVVAGDVEAVGPNVRRFKPSDQVYGFTGHKKGNVVITVGA